MDAKTQIRCLSLLLVLVILPSPVMAYEPGACILGPGDGAEGVPATDDLQSTGQNPISRYKAFRWPAVKTGDAYLFGLRIAEINTHASVTSVDLQYAVYEDNGGVIGDLKMWGYALNYNFNTLGVTRHYFDIDHVATGKTRRIISGNFYWIMFRANIGERHTMHYDRSGTAIPTALGSPCCNSLPCTSCCMKIASNATETDEVSFSTSPPEPFSVDLEYADNYYGWSVWTAASGSTTTTSTSNTTTVDGDTTSTTTIQQTSTTTTKRCICPLVCIFGEDSAEVAYLRYCRDEVLCRTPEGQKLIKIYYQWSPTIVKAMEEDEAFKTWIRETAEDVLSWMREQGE